MYIAIITLIILVCVLLGLIVLAQNPKGGGLSSQFGAGGAANLMGVKRTGDLLEKLTWGFAIGLIILSLGTHVLQGSATAGAPARSVNQQRALETRIPTGPAAPAAPAPGQPAQPRTDTPPAPATTTPTTPPAQ
ncbi:preprotein translocase subunit SecG [Hymenobacter sp. GOD-10R]|jgi:preprotein translocase subunit SecG|uniref:preprotein translocase subunit SecG n=1 Tax=Hymenobacter sp. GOD-10R TaxID=3093922 RepID=UPI002D79A780|nr:preprotein translocase subunit SecG [Hymenobacter sp. GOD-10R]WRQ30933.1 preprotein translocase subunit SecG [Hymenobacter sp. GOD-10R]